MLQRSSPWDAKEVVKMMVAQGGDGRSGGTDGSPGRGC